MLFCFATIIGDLFAGCLNSFVLKRLVKCLLELGEGKRALKLTGEGPIEQGAIFAAKSTSEHRKTLIISRFR